VTEALAVSFFSVRLVYSDPLHVRLRDDLGLESVPLGSGI